MTDTRSVSVADCGHLHVGGDHKRADALALEVERLRAALRFIAKHTVDDPVGDVARLAILEPPDD